MLTRLKALAVYEYFRAAAMMGLPTHEAVETNSMTTRLNKMLRFSAGGLFMCYGLLHAITIYSRPLISRINVIIL